MKEIEYKGLDIVKLFLEKLEKLNDKERAVIIRTIEMLNNPMFLTNLV